MQAETQEHPAIELKDKITLAIETIPEVEMQGIVSQMPGSTRQMHEIVQKVLHLQRKKKKKDFHGVIGSMCALSILMKKEIALAFLGSSNRSSIR